MAHPWSVLPVLVLATSLIWIDVPFVRQKDQGCGAASISMVMQYWKAQGHSIGSRADPDRIMEMLYSQAAKGIPAESLANYLRDQGFTTFAFAGTWADLKQHIARGRPLIVSLEANGKAGGLHYLVVAGLDEGMILVNDPAERKLLKMQRSGFEKRWKATKNWTLLAVPKQ